MAGSVSPKPYEKSSFDSLVFSNLGSPRFDISDFLKTPTDGSPKHELDEENALYSSFQGFTFPSSHFDVGGSTNISSPSTTTTTTTTTSTITDSGHQSLSNTIAKHHPLECELGAPLIFDDCKGNDFGIMDNVLNHADLIPFDDYIDGVLDGRDSFSIFNDVNYDTTVDSGSSGGATGYIPYLSTDNAMLMSALSGSNSNMYLNPDSYMGLDVGSLVDVGDPFMVGLDNHEASSSCPPDGLLYSHSQIDWTTTNQTVLFPTNLGQQGMLQCENCQLLRRIIHSNGVQDTKLEIHGRHGQSYHAVLQTRFCIDDGFPSTLEQQMVDFPLGDSEYVKQFLLQYSMLRGKEGFILRHDSLQVPMDLSSIAPERVMGGVNTQMLNQTAGQNKLNHSNCSTNPADGSVLPVKPPKSNAAAQRERTGKLKMSDLAQFFHLPINAAAKELGICPTVLKKICRRNGMRRWPHRKIKSIERIIATLEQTIAEGAGQGDESIRMEIAMLRNERAQLCAGLLGDK